MIEKRVLFIIKERVVYGTKTKCYGLFNSCDFVARKLKDCGIESKVVQVIDNNCIDREVFQFKPTHCFIEALWVVPSKFEILAKLHPTVKWIIRLHSMIPFLVSEGMSFNWINEYLELKIKKNINIEVSCNNKNLHKDLLTFNKSITYTPNIYNPDKSALPSENIEIDKSENILNIGCFGALRLLKNHAQQAFWAMQFAQQLGKTLHFHVNISEHEQTEASPVLKNLREIFKNSSHELIEHLWYDHATFLSLVKQMDLGMQLSFTETYNIVASDFVDSGIPIVVSNEINFVCFLFKADATNPSEVKRAMDYAYFGKEFNLQYFNKSGLCKSNKLAIKQWLKVL